MFYYKTNLCQHDKECNISLDLMLSKPIVHGKEGALKGAAHNVSPEETSV